METDPIKTPPEESHIQTKPSQKSESSSFGVPFAIIFAGLLIAGAVFYTNSGPTPTSAPNPPANPAVAPPQGPDVDRVKISADDHIRGNPNAKIVFVEYSDFECPYCKTFHNTMNQIMDEYGKTGEVAWVFKQFPIPQLHPKAPKEAEAAECAADIGGKDAFWAYADLLFETTPSNNGLDLAELPNIAEDIGLDRDAFIQCLDSGRLTATVEASYQDAINIGVTGTPTTVVITSDGERAILPGAQPYSVVKSLVESQL